MRETDSENYTGRRNPALRGLRSRWLGGRGLLLSAMGLFLWLLVPAAYGAKIGDLIDTRWIDQALRFWTFKDPSVRYAFIGAILIGINCGLLGSFIVMKRLSLLGDTVSHAVLPGVALGFLWNMSKDPVAIFVGATVFGLIGTVTVNLIQQTTHIKEDSALGMVLAGFYGIGICLFTMIQRLDAGNQSGIDNFMFGQAAALSEADLWLMAVITALAVALISFFYRQFLVTTFDRDYARSIGIPAQCFHYTLMVLLTFGVVVSLQATGVVLVSAMLIIPPASAYLLTDRMHYLLLLAAVFGSVSAVAGAFFSFLGNDLPTGPFMVVGATLVFCTAFVFGPRHGLLPRWVRHLNRTRRIRVENTLKAIYQVLESGHGTMATGVALPVLASRLNEPLQPTERRVRELVRENLATVHPSPAPTRSGGERHVALTPDGWVKACEMVRNHRLWELYLTDAAQYEVDHVHEDAEKIEHILGEETVRQLERRLNSPSRDPHGKPIPSQADMELFQGPDGTSEAVPGYKQPL